MRPRPPVLFVALLPFIVGTAAFADADAVAGRESLLVGDAWVHVHGGPITHVDVTPTSAAFAGARFLIGWIDGTTLHVGLLEERASTPLSDSTLSSSAIAPAVIRWDGTRYIVFWNETADSVRAAAVSAQGVVEKTVTISVPKFDDMATNGSTIALTRMYSPSADWSGVVDVIILGSDFKQRRAATVGSMKRSQGLGETYVSAANIVPFGTGFFAAWRQLRSGRYDDVVGTRVTIDGRALDVGPSTRESSGVAGPILDTFGPTYDLDLYQFEKRMAVLSLREQYFAVSASFMEGGGAVTRAKWILQLTFRPRFDTVQLLDGTVVAVVFGNEFATVRPLLRETTRRRSTRH